jgi:zinc transport system ATP-binding protein
MEEVMLSVKNLNVAFGNLPIFHNLSFDVKRGEIVAVIGPNGAGKTVLFRALIGSAPYEGEIVWAPGASIGYVPQRLDIDRHNALNLGDFFALKTRILRLPGAAAREAMDAVHLPVDRLTNPLGNLSSGELQRALIAFALIGSPNVLLFDEPTAGVDLPGEEQIYQTLHKLQDEKGLTLIFISHDLNLVYRYATKVICLSRGLVCFGSPEETLTPKVLDQLYGSAMFHHIHENEVKH